MTKETFYRLGRYEIIEKENGQVWWESHSGLGSAKGGKCFVEGNILFIGPSKTEKAGFLKREFMERLNQLPPWQKTKYYSPSHTIYNCKTGRVSPELGAREELNKQNNSKSDIVSKEGVNGGTISKSIVGTKATTKVKKKIVWAWRLFKDLLGRYSH
ncbi:MAG: hypothetical protein ABIN18_27220 [Pseudomonadota bacterium]